MCSRDSAISGYFQAEKHRKQMVSEAVLDTGSEM